MPRLLLILLSASALAKELGAHFQWELQIVPNADHDNAKMAPAAAERMFGK